MSDTTKLIEAADVLIETVEHTVIFIQAERPKLAERLLREAHALEAALPRQVIGYQVLAKRPMRHDQKLFDYESAGGVWPTIEPVENHQAYCQMSAADNPERYGTVEYVVAEITLAAPSVTPGGEEQA